MTNTTMRVGTKATGPRASEELLQVLADKSAGLRAAGAGREELSRAAAFGLVHEGVNPTVALVRRITNLGANDAIARDLEKIRGELGDVVKRRTLKTEMPEAYLTLAENMLEGLWTGALTESKKAFDTERAAIEQVCTEAKASQGLAEALLATTQEELARSHQANEDLGAGNLVLSTEIASLKTQAEDQAVAMADLREQLVEEKRERELERQRAGAEIEATRAEHQRALEAAEGNRRYALLQLDQARNSERALAQRIRDLEAEMSLREEQARRTANSLRDKIGELTLETGELKGNLVAKSEEVTRLSSRVINLESRLVEDAVVVAERAANALAAARTELLEQTLANARNTPEIFEWCELNDAQVIGRIDGNGVILLSLVSLETNEPVGPADADVKSLKDFAKLHLE